LFRIEEKKRFGKEIKWTSFVSLNMKGDCVLQYKVRHNVAYEMLLAVDLLFHSLHYAFNAVEACLQIILGKCFGKDTFNNSLEISCDCEERTY